MKTQKGFTLIELLVVIAIIGILAAVVLVSVNSVRKKAKQVAVRTEMRTLQTAFTFKLDNNGTFYGYCYNPPSYNYPELKNIADAIKKFGYSFICEESDENNNCDINGSWLNSKWYAVACNNNDSNDCFCTDSTGSLIAGSSSLLTIGINNCACQ